MDFYAQFDPNAEAPRPVIGWYDTGTFDYPNLPPATSLISVPGQQWITHFNQPHGWTVANGQLIPPSA
jgi:hypothetical protein